MNQLTIGRQCMIRMMTVLQTLGTAFEKIGGEQGQTENALRVS